jgi:hypothetical protein
MSILSYNNIKVKNEASVFSLAGKKVALQECNDARPVSPPSGESTLAFILPSNTSRGGYAQNSFNKSCEAPPYKFFNPDYYCGMLCSIDSHVPSDFPVRLDNRKQVGIEEINPLKFKPIHTEDPKWFEKYDELRTKRQILADVLIKAGHLKEAESVRKCGERFIAYKAECCGDTLAYPVSCGHRLCPVCMVKRSVRLSSKVEKLIKKMENPKHIVLTAKNVPKIDKTYFKWLRECFVKLRHRDIFSKCVGGFYSIETTYNSKLKNWHVHIHIIVDVPYILKSYLSRDWKEIIGNSYIVDIHEIKNPLEAAREVAKYVVKPGDFLQDSQLVHEYLKAVRGMRLVSTFGKYYHMPLDEDEEDGVPECYCGKCKVLENPRNHLKYAWRQLKGFYSIIAVFKDTQGFYRLNEIISDG